MCKKIFIAATGKNCGKTTTSLSLLHLARRKYGRVGFIKPVGPKPAVLDGHPMDMDAALVAQVYDLRDDLSLMSPVVVYPGTTRDVLDGRVDPGALREKIVSACAELERRCDFLIIEGAGHGGVGSVIGLGNADVARMLAAPVLMVAEGGIGNTVDTVTMNLALYQQKGCDVGMLLANKLIPAKRTATLGYLGKAFADTGIRVAGGFNWSPILANPTLNHISAALKLPLQGDLSQGSRIVHHIQLGAASAQRVADMLEESTLLIVTSTRDELLVMMASLYGIPEYRDKIIGLIIPGYSPVSEISQKILDRSNIPYMRIAEPTSDVFTATKDHVSKITAQDGEKIRFIQQSAESDLDFDAIDELFSQRRGRGRTSS